MKFIFKAKDKMGMIKEGNIDASSAESAVEVLQQNELFPIYIKEEKSGDLTMKKVLKMLDKVNEKEKMLFFKQLSVLIEARVPIVTSLEAIGDQINNLFFKKVIEETIQSVKDGLPLSDSLNKNRDVFGNLAINIIKAGEVSGNLKKSIDYVAKNIEKNYNLSRKVKGALLYPAIVMVVFSVISFIFMTFILPKLTMMIKSLEVKTPWYTNLIIGLGDFMSQYWWANIIIILGVIGGFYYYINTDNGKREMDEIKLKLPIFGPIFQKIYIARFTDNLNVLLAGGLPIVRALTLAGSVVNNFVYQALFLRLADEVKIGGNMSDILKKSSHIPPIVSQIIKIGEESGEIEMVLGYISKFYEQEVDSATKNLSTLIEPILMVIIGIAVGVLVFSILMPIYDIAGQM